MAKKQYMSDERFQELLGSVKEMNAIRRGEIKPKRVTVRELPEALEARQKLKFSRSEFASAIGVSERTLESWEQGRRNPSGAASVLLKIAKHNPKAVLRAVRNP
jgi:putative transcriptional regulator